MSPRPTREPNRSESPDAFGAMTPNTIVASYVIEWGKTLEVIQGQFKRLSKSASEVELVQHKLDEMQEKWDTLWDTVRHLEAQVREVGGRAGSRGDDFPALSETGRLINGMRNEIHRIEVSTPSVREIHQSCAKIFARSWGEVKGQLDELCVEMCEALAKPRIQEGMDEAKRAYVSHLMATVKREMDRPTSEYGADPVGQLRLRAHLLAEAARELGAAFAQPAAVREGQGVSAELALTPTKKSWVKQEQLAGCTMRWAITSDIPDIVRIERACFRDPWSAAEFQTNLRQRNIVGQVIEWGGAVRGYVVYHLTRQKVEILNLAIDPDFQGMGLGRQLVERLKEKLTPDRRHEISLVIRETNVDGQLCFKALGFRAVKTKDNFYQGLDEQAYVMSFKLPANP